MRNPIKSAPIYLIVYILIAWCIVSTAGAQNIQLVPNGACLLVPDTNKCFDLRTQTINVGKEVSSLGNLYKFCTKIINFTQSSPARIILVIDNSGSMCRTMGGITASDPTNMRITAANNFVDSVAIKCSACEIGVIQYKDDNVNNGASTVVARLNPLNVGIAANLALIHAAIDASSCGRGHAIHKITDTYSGIALDTAVLTMIDLGYDSLVKANLARHIIMMTDGDWRTPVANDIYLQYLARNPGLPFPTIHGVFMGTGTSFDLSNLDTATLLCTRNTPPSPRGLFFQGVTPATIVAAFSTLVQTIMKTTVIGLQSVTFTNTSVTPPDSRLATVILNSGTQNVYTVRVPQFALQYGVNTFTITSVTKDSTGKTSDSVVTITINRSTSSGLANDSLFTLQCGADTIPLSITCKPTAILLPAYDTVTAKVVNPVDASRFTPNDILLRAFIPFPDNDSSLALFHFDNNSLINSAQNGNAGTGTVTYTTANAAFNGSISGGSFNATLSKSIGANNDFTVECWIKPPSTNEASTMVSGSGFSFGLTADGYLLATIGNTSIKTGHVIDKNVWQCVAVARSGGKAAIYINGIPMATATAAAGAIPTALSISSVSGGLLDEVRISSGVRSQQIQGKTVLQIPLASQLLWNINTVQTTGQTARLPFALWQGAPAGQVQFVFSSTLPGPMIINFFDTSSSPVSIMWSKNGDPVLFSTTGLAVSATLRDTSHEGHLDMIDLKWSENSTIATPLPAANQLVLSVTIVTLDGKIDTLHPAGVVLDAANKVIHIILSENNSKARGKYETGWVDGSAKIVISPDLKITTDGKPIVITQIIDGATPIPTSSCYANSQNSDSLWITFSEPLTKDTSVSKDNILRDSTTQRLTQLGPTFSGRVGDKMLFVFPITGGNHQIVPYSNKISEFFSPGPNSPTVEISYCSNNKLIEKVLVGPNPVSQTNPQNIKITTPDGAQISVKGIKIEVILTRPLVGPNNKQELEGFLSVFDAVGNVLIDEARLYPEAGKPRALALVWDLKNKRGSLVGSGTYASRIKVRNTSSNYEEIAEKPPIIGVKKEK